MSVGDADLRAFEAEVRRLRGRGEPPLYPAFRALLEAAYGRDFTVDTLLGTPGAGFPDVTISRDERLVNWVEVKAPTVEVDSLPGPDAERFDRYRRALPHIVLTNGWKWLLFQDGDEAGRVEIPQDWLLGNQALAAEDSSSLADFLERLRGLPAVRALTVEHAVELLASAAKVVYHAVEDLEEEELPDTLREAREAMTELLKTNPADPSSLSLDTFADNLAQLCTFGYLTARVEAGENVTPATAVEALSQVEHPFLQSTLYALWAPDPELRTALGGALRTAVDAVNAAAPQLAGPGGRWKQVPYVYEDFFAAYRPEDRFRYGVFYTPEQVTRFQVREVQRTLVDEFGLRGLTDPAVRFLDPACGTGTYLLALGEEALAEAQAAGLPTSSTLLELFEERVVGFEVSPGPAAVAQARLTAWLRAQGVTLGRRFPVYTVNTLTPPHAAGGGGSPNLWINSIGDEQAAGDRVKREEPVLVVLGNPPWGDRPRATFEVGPGSNLVQEWARGVQAAVINLYDLYVAFWRFACDLLLDRPSVQEARGIVSYITNRSWIYGRAYSGMRRWLRDRNARAAIVDVGGDIRAGAGHDDEPVFDIRAGSAIATLTFGGRTGDEPGPIEYRRVRGARGEKLEALDSETLPEVVQVSGRKGDHFGPVDWGPLDDAPSIKDLFHARFPGVKTHRDELIIDVDREKLLRRMRAWNELPDDRRREDFGPTRDREEPPPSDYVVDEAHVSRHRYRPLDDRWLYNDRRFIDQSGTVSKVFRARPDTECLLTLDTRTTEGPVVIAACALPGYNSFRGSYETHVFPIQPAVEEHGWADPDTMPLTEGDLLKPDTRRWAEGFGASARDVGAYLLALGNAPRYVEAFGDALAVDTVRFPLVEDQKVFEEAVRVGHKILDAWCLRADPIGTWDQKSTGQPLGEPSIEGGTVVFGNGDKLTGFPAEIGELEVSRWPIFERFLEARVHLPLSVELGREIQKVVAAAAVILDTRQTCNDLLRRAIEASHAGGGPAGGVSS